MVEKVKTKNATIKNTKNLKTPSQKTAIMKNGYRLQVDDLISMESKIRQIYNVFF